MTGHKEEIGRALRDARQSAGLTLKEIADAIRIRPIYLQAIEGGQFELLPALPQTVGFTRAYAKYLHVDVERPLSQLGEEVHRHIESADYSEPELPWTQVSGRRIAYVGAGAVAGLVLLAAMIFEPEAPPPLAGVAGSVAQRMDSASVVDSESLFTPEKAAPPRAMPVETHEDSTAATSESDMRSISYRRESAAASSSVPGSSVHASSPVSAGMAAMLMAPSGVEEVAPSAGHRAFATRSVYLRSAPANSGEVVGVLDPCEKLSLLGQDGNVQWHQIRREDGTTGWVYRAYVGEGVPRGCS